MLTHSPAWIVRRETKRDRHADLGEAGPRSPSPIVALLLKHWRRRPYFLAAQLILILAATVCDMGAPWAVSDLLNIVSRTVRVAEDAFVAVSIIALLYAAQYLLRTISWWINNRLTSEIMQNLGQDVLGRVQRFSADWHANNGSGLSVRHVSRAMEAYNILANALFISLLPSAIILVGMTLSISLRWPMVGVLVASVALVYTLMNFRLMARWVRPANLRSNALDTTLSASVGDVVGGQATVRSFAAEAIEDLRFARLVGEWRVAVLTTWDRFNYLSAIQNAVLIVLQVVLLGLLTWSWSKGRASAGDVAFAVSAFLLIAGYLRALPEALRLLRRGLDELFDATVFPQAETVVLDKPGARSLGVGASGGVGSIVFDKVVFGYPGARASLYRGLDLSIAAGERVALVGPTGAGKSTFVKLLTRQYDLQDGRILVGASDIRDVSQASLRRSIAVMPQEPHLFNRTISDNIAFGRLDATPGQIRRAAELACAHGFIASLPNGYDTVVGAAGAKLSGGERQRIVLARAFLKDAPILVLDEATSSLDAETERLVSHAIQALMRGRTTVIIAHRLNIVRQVDRVLFMQDGAITEAGEHDMLMRRGGSYAKLVKTSASVT